MFQRGSWWGNCLLRLFSFSFKEIAELMQPNTILLVNLGLEFVKRIMVWSTRTTLCTFTHYLAPALALFHGSFLVCCFPCGGCLTSSPMNCLFFVLFFIPSIKQYNTVKLKRNKISYKKIFLTTHYQKNKIKIWSISPHFSLGNEQRNLHLRIQNKINSFNGLKIL